MSSPVALGTEIGEITIDRRFNGPESSANGGYTCGRLAAFLPEPAEVTLRVPPPLGRPLTVHRVDSPRRHETWTVELRDGETLVAEGRPCEPVGLEPPVRPSWEQAVEASAAHPGRGQRHPLSDCFVCSPYRAEPGDGLGLSPGPLAGEPEVGAAPFLPDESLAATGGGFVALEVVWAALDCPSFAPPMMRAGRIALLGRLAAQREREIEIGERLVVVGWEVASEGRKHHAAAALLDGNGETVARSRATWIELRP